MYGPKPLRSGAILGANEIQRASKRFRDMTAHIKGTPFYAEVERLTAATGLIERSVQEGRLTQEEGDNLTAIFGSVYSEKLSELKRAYAESGLQNAMEAQDKALNHG